MKPTYIGKFPVKQPDRYIFSRSFGDAVVQEWVGPRVLIYGLVGQLRQVYDTVEVDDDGLLARVRGTSRGPVNGEVEQAVTTFELADEEQVYDLAYLPMFSGLSGPEVSQVEAAVDDRKTDTEFDEDWSAAVTKDPTKVRPGNRELARILLDKRRRGTSSFVESAWAFTMTINASRYYPWTIDFTGHNKLWTDSQVNSLANQFGGIPNFVLPASPNNPGVGLASRWRRYQSAVALSNRGSFNLTMGWKLAHWDTDIYTAF